MKEVLRHLRKDIPGIFNEAFILKNHLDRWNHAIDKDVILPPYEILIHPCSKCNLRCEWCIGGNVETRDSQEKKDLQMLPSNLMDPDKMEKLIQGILNYKKELDVVEKGEKIKKTYRVENVSFSGIVGEPLIAKKSFIRAVDLLTKNNIRVGLFSNAALLDDELIEKIVKISYINVSIDAGTAKTYAKLKYGGAKEGELVFDRILENIKKLVRIRSEFPDSKLEINVSYILYPSNYKEIYKAGKMFKELGIDNFRMKQDNSGKVLLSIDQMSEANVLLEKVDQIVDKNFNFIKIHKLNNPEEMKRCFGGCTITDLMAAVGCDGDVYPCNYHPRVGGFSYGSALENDFGTIWEGDQRMKIRNLIPSICPKVCDPFKNRSNRLFEEIKKYRVKNGKNKTDELIKEIINIIN